MNKSKYYIIKLSIYIFIALFLIFLVGLCAFAMSPSSSDLALALEQKNNDSQQNTIDKIDASGLSWQNTILEGDNNSKTLQNQDSVSWDSNLSDPQSYSDVNDDSGYVMQITPQILKKNEMLKNKQNQTDLSSQNLESTDFPASFDLRNVDGKIYDSSVKFQNPWGTCWAFGTIAASEISLQSALNKSVDEYPIDLSEKHLSWFAKNHIPDIGEAGYDPNNFQAGEGFWYTDDITDRNSSMEGGLLNYVSQAFSCGFGPVVESDFPYRGILGRVSAKINNKVVDFNSYEEAIEAGYEPRYYSKNDDWSISECSRLSSLYKLQNSLELPNPKPIKNEKGEYTLNETGVNSIKNALLDKKGVGIAYLAERSSKRDDPSKATERFTNTDNWAYYVWDESFSDLCNHAVCIVGYDDNYSKENFTVENPAKWDANCNVVYKLNGMNLENDASGNPYYEKVVDDKTVQVIFDKNSILIELQEGSTSKYKLKNTELENNTSGNPYYPDGTRTLLMPDVDILCEVVRDGSGSHLPQGDGAWICKNSWGSNSQSFPNHNDWGLDGYFYLSYYDLSICLPQTFEFEINSSNDRQSQICYQHDYMITENINSSIFDDASFSDFRSGNVFTASQDTLLDSVSVSTSYENTKCEVNLYLLNEDFSDPEEGELLDTQIDNFTYKGYHTIDLNNEIIIPEGKKFSVMVKQELISSDNNTSTSQIMSLSTNTNKEFMIDNNYSGYYSKGVVNNGETYVAYTNKDANTKCSYDWNDFITTQDYYTMSSNFFDDSKPRKYFDIDNVPVKAYGKTISSPLPSDNNQTIPSSLTEDTNQSYNEINDTASTGDFIIPYILIPTIIISLLSLLCLLYTRQQHYNCCSTKNIFEIF